MKSIQRNERHLPPVSVPLDPPPPSPDVSAPRRAARRVGVHRDVEVAPAALSSLWPYASLTSRTSCPGLGKRANGSAPLVDEPVMVSRKLFQFSLASEPAHVPVVEAPAPEDDPTELSHRLRSGRPSLGSLLVEAGYVTEDQVKDALAEGLRTGERLGEVLVRRREVTDEVIAELLANQWQVPFVKTAALSVDPTAIRQFPHRVARELDAVPIGFEHDGVVLVAIAEPSEDTFRRLSERLPDCSCVVIARSALDSLLESRLYAATPEEGKLSFEPEPKPVAVELSTPEPFAWGSVTDIEPTVRLVDAFDEQNEADAPLLYDEPEPEFTLESESESTWEPESEPESESEPEPESEWEPQPESDPEPKWTPEPVAYGWEPPTPVAEELDPYPVAVPDPARVETTAELPPVAYGEDELPSGIDAAMAAITATSTELDKVRSEVASLGRALELARRQLAERDAQLAETRAALADRDAQREAAQRTASEERESAQQLRAELDGNSTVIAAIKQQVAGLSERLDSIAPAGAEPTEH